MSLKTIKILFPIGTYFPAQLGGPGNTIYWLAKMLHQRGNEVYVGTTNKGIQDASIEYNKWLIRDCGKVLYQHTVFLYAPMTLFLKLTRILRKVEIVHLTNVFYPLSWMMACWIKLTGSKVKILWSVRGEFDDAALQFSPGRKKLAIFLVRKFLKKGITFHATSAHEVKCIYNKLGTDVNVVQHPNYMLMPAKENAKITKTILYLGRIHPIKGIDQLIRAYALLENKKSVDLVIAGEGDQVYTEKLKSLVHDSGIEDHVRFTGHVEKDEKQKLLSSSYVLVLPSHTENFGNVVVEALAQGTPVIASQHTPWSVLEEVVPGSWVPNSPENLHKAIQHILNCSPEVYAGIREKAYALCRDHFSMEKNISHWEDTYAQLLQNTKEEVASIKSIENVH